MSEPAPPEPGPARGCRPQVMGCLVVGLMLAIMIGLMLFIGLSGSERIPDEMDDEAVGLGAFSCFVFGLFCGIEDDAAPVDPGEAIVAVVGESEGECTDSGAKDHAVVIFRGISRAAAENAWGRLESSELSGFVIDGMDDWHTNLYKPGLTRCEAEELAALAVEVGLQGLSSGDFFGAIVMPWAGNPVAPAVETPPAEGQTPPAEGETPDP